VPIAFPLIAGTGTLTTIMSLKANYEDQYILIGILVNLVFIFIALHLLKWLEKILGKAGLIAVRKFFGVILLAIAVRSLAPTCRRLEGRFVG
jgi:multiple antibiotic resistance protein